MRWLYAAGPRAGILRVRVEAIVMVFFWVKAERGGDGGERDL